MIGLSTAHIRPEHAPRLAALRIAAGARAIKLKGWPILAPRAKDGRRGLCKGFSRQSRSRLMLLLGAIPTRWDARPPLFVTLTYPAEYPDAPTSKKDLASLLKRVKRRWPRSVILWRLELQDRGAPHYHLICWNLPYLPHWWLAEAWYQIVASGDPRHLAAGTRVERCKSQRHLMSYAAKYAAKLDAGATEALQHLGRIWGVQRKQLLGILWWEQPVSYRTFHMLRRALRGLARARGWRWRGKPPGRGAWLYSTERTGWQLLGWARALDAA